MGSQAIRSKAYNGRNRTDRNEGDEDASRNKPQDRGQPARRRLIGAGELKNADGVDPGNLHNIACGRTRRLADLAGVNIPVIRDTRFHVIR